MNIPLLLCVITIQDSESLPVEGVLDAIRFIIKNGLQDMESQFIKNKRGETIQNSCKQRLSRSIAASIAPTICFLRRLMNHSLIVDSQLSTVLSKMKHANFVEFVGPNVANYCHGADKFFHAGKFTRTLHCRIAQVTLDIFTDPKIRFTAAYVLHTVLILLKEITIALEESKKPLEKLAILRTGAAATGRVVQPLL